MVALNGYCDWCKFPPSILGKVEQDQSEAFEKSYLKARLQAKFDLVKSLLIKFLGSDLNQTAFGPQSLLSVINSSNLIK